MNHTRLRRRAGEPRRRVPGAPALRAGLAVLAVLLLAVACGKVGPVRPPGPAEAITYPRQYPSH